MVTGGGRQDVAEKGTRENGQQALPLVHHPLEVERRGRQHHVDRVAGDALEEVAPEAVVRLEVPDDGLYRRPAPAGPAQPARRIPAAPRLAVVGYLYQRPAHLPAPPVAPVAGRRGGPHAERLPPDRVGEGEEQVAAVERVLQAEEEALLAVGGWLCVHGVSPGVSQVLQGFATYITKTCRF